MDMKKCNHCTLNKELSEFGKDKHSGDGINPKCKECCKKFQAARKEAKAAYDKEYRKQNHAELKQRDIDRHRMDPERGRLYKLLKKFGLTPEDEQRMLKEQDHKCAICKKPEWVKVRGKVKRLAVDHRHSDKKVRGLLCNNCNRAFGLLFEDIDTIRNMLEYAIKHKG